MISLDGVLQSPGAPTEDLENDFTWGGWVAPFDDDTYGEAVMEELKPADYLLGRKTFEIWENYWPAHADFWPGIMEGIKYVYSNTRQHTHWKNTKFIPTLADIQALKNTDGMNIQVWGSSELVHLLLQHDLVDELRLKIHPLILGKGKKLFDDKANPAAFTLSGTTVTTTGVILANYLRAGDVQTGTIGG